MPWKLRLGERKIDLWVNQEIINLEKNNNPIMLRYSNICGSFQKTCFPFQLVKTYKATLRSGHNATQYVLGAGDDKVHTVQKDYDALDDSGICEKCYKEAEYETEKEHKSEIDYLNAKVSFLGFQSLIESPLQGPCPYLTCFTDFTLVASRDDSCGPAIPIPAHKAVLVSRSPVFRAMLENEMEETLSGTVKINDASHEALFAFVNFLYTAEARLDEDMASELLVLAEKYQVQHLKTFCENFLIPRLDWDNSITSYAFAHQHNAKRLIEAALSVITSNMYELTEREEYLELKAKDPRLVVEIYEAYLSKQINGAI